MTPSYRVEAIDAVRWRVPRQRGMRAEGLIFADRAMMDALRGDEAVTQVANVAHLPGLVGPAIAMPDIHWGYGFPIGGVAAFDLEGGVISPGGVGYDINCGVRLLATPLTAEELRPRAGRLLEALAAAIPSGVGRARADLRLSDGELDGVLEGGAAWAVGRGFGPAADLERIEGGGRLPGARPEQVSARARARGRDQLGTVGSGNHFVEVGFVAEAYDEAAAATLGLAPGQVTVLIHSGSRGLGHQVCDDFLDRMLAAARRHGIPLPDKQLCCAPLGSPEAEAYWGAMNGAANFAFANRQVMTHHLRSVLAELFGAAAAEGSRLVYDVCHNIAKRETHAVDGRPRALCVHRKGATRAFPPGHPELPPDLRALGQPVLVPGDMGRYSYVLLGTAGAFDETFGSSCHGAGRRLSRHLAKRLSAHRDVAGELAARGVVVRAASRATLAEELPEAYKDVAEVVAVVARAGIGRLVARLQPLAVLKG